VDPRKGGSVDLGGVEAVDGGSLRNVWRDGNTLRWQYDAADETRTFRLGYTLSGEITRATDAALFDRLFIEPVHAPVDAWSLTLRLPRPASLYKVFIITERGLIGTLRVDPEKAVATASLPDIGENEWVRVRVIVDPDQVPGVAMGSEPRYEAWLAETAGETEGFRRSSRADAGPPRKPFPAWLALPIALVGLVFAFWAFQTWQAKGTEPAVGEIGEYQREPPEEVPPGVVPFLLTQASPGLKGVPLAIGATLLDFAKRGFLEFREQDKTGIRGFFGGREVALVRKRTPGHGELLPWEGELWGTLMEASEDGETVRLEAFLKQLSTATTWIASWSEKPRKWYEETRAPLLAQRNTGLMVLFIAMGVALGGGLVFLGAASLNPAVFGSGLVFGPVTMLAGIVAGANMPRWEAGALLRARKWRAYRKFLADFSAMEEAPANHYQLWDHHFLYATALGVSKKYLANLRKLMAREPDRFATPAWIGGSGGGALGATDRLTTAEARLAGIQANLSALESALSSATSSGGGFSGGGSGGSSGGGGSSGAS
jgi:uncharacterized membrane protein YgcG